jgi:hypothetical protein
VPSPAPLTALAAFALAVATSPAHAEQRLGASVMAEPRPTFQWVPTTPREDGGTQNVSSRIVYLKRCPLSGCVLRYGTQDDSRTGTSMIVEEGTRVLGAFTQPTEVWNDLVACVQQTFAPFDITITDQNPGDVPHFLNVIGGRVSDVTSKHPNAAGLAPFNCREIPNAIVYTFDVFGPDVHRLCWTSAQEIAHAFGLEHQYLQKDPMTYLDGDLPKRFRDVVAPCGEYMAAGCSCGGTTQNTYRKILALLGAGAPTPPEVAFRRPVAGGQVQPGFRATITAEDDVRVDTVELVVGGVVVGSTMTELGGRYLITAPALGAGEHTLEARATDVQGAVGTTTLTVTEGPPCTAAKGCQGNDVCVEGVCVPGPDDGGGLGAICKSDVECLSHRCADAGEPLKHCVEACNPGNPGSCPADFACIAAGEGGVCWPDPGGGCCDAGRDARGWLLLCLAVGLVLFRRRR